MGIWSMKMNASVGRRRRLHILAKPTLMTAGQKPAHSTINNYSVIYIIIDAKETEWLATQIDTITISHCLSPRFALKMPVYARCRCKALTETLQIVRGVFVRHQQSNKFLFIIAVTINFQPFDCIVAVLIGRFNMKKKISNS